MSNNNFDFNSFNKMMFNAGSGLRFHLAMQLLRDVAITYERFNNPLEDDLRGAITDLKDIQRRAKQQAEERASKTGKLMASDGQSE